MAVPSFNKLSPEMSIVSRGLTLFIVRIVGFVFLSGNNFIFSLDGNIFSHILSGSLFSPKGNSPGQRPRACLRKFRAPTTDQKPGHRPLSFSSGGDLGGYRAVVFRLFFVAKNHLHFYCQNLEKTMVFGGQNGIENSIFRVLEGIGFRH